MLININTILSVSIAFILAVTLSLAAVIIPEPDRVKLTSETDRKKKAKP